MGKISFVKAKGKVKKSEDRKREEEEKEVARKRREDRLAEEKYKEDKKQARDLGATMSTFMAHHLPGFGDVVVG